MASGNAVVLYKALLGALLMVALHFFTQTKNYYLSHLALSCPLLSASFHYFLVLEKGVQNLQKTLVFGLFALIPFTIYLVTLYFIISRFNIYVSLSLSGTIWITSALLLVVYWKPV